MILFPRSPGLKNILNWSEEAILSGTLATHLSDYFGYSVAINSTGDRVIVGAYEDEKVSGASASGLAYIFVSGAGGWTQQHILSGTLATSSGDNFGYSVAMNSTGDRVVVGAYNDERPAGAFGEGLAYIFVSGTSGWTQQHILSGTLATDSSDFFGFSVAMNSTGDRVVVGTYLDERIGGAEGEGLAYIFVSGAGGWTQQHILSGTLATSSLDLFGSSVAMNSTGDRIVVGAYQDERVGQSPDQDGGVAYIFVSGAGGWTQQHILSGSLILNNQEYFGYSVAMNSTGDRVIVGAIQGVYDSNGYLMYQGSAYIFVSGTSGWFEEKILDRTFNILNDPETGLQFGLSVGMNALGNLVTVGCPGEGFSQGTVYVFVSGTGGWTAKQILSGTLATDSFDSFGISVAMNSTGERLIVGAWLDERPSGASAEGLAYIYKANI